jgi:hypothetical protein
MIRFEPDSLVEAILRPAAMALPQSWVYTEIMAPDLRFMMLGGLCLVSLYFLIMGRPGAAWPMRLRVMLAVVVLAFPVWLLTGGNGRYFMPIILVVGPVCIAVLYTLPVRMSVKLLIFGVFTFMQAVVVSTNSPWQSFDSLEWVRWRSSDYFDLDTTDVSKDRDVTYVSLPGQTYAMVAPLFPSDSHWINLTSFQGQDFMASQGRVILEAKRRLKEADNLRLIVRSQPRQSVEDSGLPNQVARNVLDAAIRPFGLQLTQGGECKLLVSKTFGLKTSVVTTDTPELIARVKAHAGFWVCQINFGVVHQEVGNATKISEAADRAVRKVETMCPRLFPPGQTVYRRSSYGFDRTYADSDSYIAYVASEEQIYVKMIRALNPQPVGRVSSILAQEFRLDCGSFVGREGLPWMRHL